MSELVETIAKKYPGINLPIKCPLCDSKLVINETWSRISCPNKNCYTYMHSRITKYLSTMGVMHISGAIVDTLMDEGFLSDIPDLYTIDWDKVSKLDGFGKTSTTKYKREINNHRTCTVAKFLSGFNIAGMGETQISKMIGSLDLDDVLKASWKEFLEDGIGEITAKKFKNGLKELRDIIEQTSKYIDFEDEDDSEPSSDTLSGLSFCFTGKIEGYTRNELEQIVIDNGGKIGSVNSKLNYLCSDDKNSTSSKMIKAKELGIKIITSKEFLKMINE